MRERVRIELLNSDVTYDGHHHLEPPALPVDLPILVSRPPCLKNHRR